MSTFSGSAASVHTDAIADQFTRQAPQFATSRALHNEAALNLLVGAAAAKAGDVTLDVACGPGSVVVAFAQHVKHAVGVDATPAMLAQAQRLATSKGLTNVTWRLGYVEALPFADCSFDVVSCRFAVHHFLEPQLVFAEMLRVCRPGGRIVLCDAFAADDPAKAAAFNAMERHRDPSTVEFRTLAYLRALFAQSGLPQPEERFYGVPAEREKVIAMSFPANDDREGLRRMIDASVDGDAMGLDARRDGDTVRFAYPTAILVSSKADQRGY